VSKIIDLGSLRVSRSEIKAKNCNHLSLSYDPIEKTIWCNDCKAFIDPFNAFLNIVYNLECAYEKLNRERHDLAIAKQKEVSLIAAKKVEEAWRSRTMLPSCPHCSEAIFPEDNLGSIMTNKQMAIDKRRFKKK